MSADKSKFSAAMGILPAIRLYTEKDNESTETTAQETLMFTKREWIRPADLQALITSARFIWLVARVAW